MKQLYDTKQDGYGFKVQLYSHLHDKGEDFVLVEHGVDEDWQTGRTLSTESKTNFYVDRRYGDDANKGNIVSVSTSFDNSPSLDIKIDYLSKKMSITGPDVIELKNGTKEDAEFTILTIFSQAYSSAEQIYNDLRVNHCEDPRFAEIDRCMRAVDDLFMKTNGDDMYKGFRAYFGNTHIVFG